jgi:hypothetical protein
LNAPSLEPPNITKTLDPRAVRVEGDLVRPRAGYFGVGAPPGAQNTTDRIQRGEVALAIKSAVKHTSCRDLTPHQWGVWHGVEPVDALVLEEITTLLIQPIVRFGDSKGSHKSGMGACQWLVIGHAVILFEPEIFAEHGPMARPRFTAFDKFSDHGGLKRLTRILMLEHPL